MVVEKLLGLVGVVVAWLLGIMPHLAVPSYIASAGDDLSYVLTQLDGSSGWVPWGVLFAAIALMVATLVMSVVIRGIRMTLSLLTGGGGGS